MSKVFVLVLLFCWSFLAPNDSYGQDGRKIDVENGALKVGDTVPKSFMRMIPHTANNKLIILDFWNTLCTSCIASFPKIDKLVNEFPNELLIVLMNSSEDEVTAMNRIKAIDKNRVGKNLPKLQFPNVPLLYKDPLFFELFPHQGEPHHIWLNADGKVLAITDGYNATEKNIRDVIAGKSINLGVKNYVGGYDVRKEGWMKPGHKALPAPVLYSAIIPYFSGVGSGVTRSIDSTAGVYRVTFRNYSLLLLYQIAFLSQSKRLIMEVKDNQDLKEPTDIALRDAWIARNSFTYEQVIPLKEIEESGRYMQEDLNRFFSKERGLTGTIVKRKVNCWILKQEEHGIAPSKGGKQEIVRTKEYSKWNNTEFKVFVNSLTTYLADNNSSIYLIEETGVVADQKIDIQLSGNLKDRSNLEQQLKRVGLKIVDGERGVDFLLIKD